MSEHERFCVLRIEDGLLWPGQVCARVCGQWVWTGRWGALRASGFHKSLGIHEWDLRGSRAPGHTCQGLIYGLCAYLRVRVHSFQKVRGKKRIKQNTTALSRWIMWLRGIQKDYCDVKLKNGWEWENIRIWKTSEKLSEGAKRNDKSKLQGQGIGERGWGTKEKRQGMPLARWGDQLRDQGSWAGLWLGDC